MGVFRCLHCGSEYFSGASDCPRCGRIIERDPVRYVDGGPQSAHYLGAIFAAVISAIGIHNLFRAFDGESVYIWRNRRDWVVIQPAEDWYSVVVLAWLVIVPTAIYFARRHLLIGNSMGHNNAR